MTVKVQVRVRWRKRRRGSREYLLFIYSFTKLKIVKNIEEEEDGG